MSASSDSAEEIVRFYHESEDMKGTQLVFCDLSTPKKAFEDYEYGKDFDEEAARYEWPADVLPHLDFQWEEDDEESIHRVCPRTFDRWWGDDTF